MKRLLLGVSLFFFIGSPLGLLMAVEQPVVLDTRFARLQIWPSDGHYEIVDKRGGVTWQSDPIQKRFGEITYWGDGKQQRANLASCEVVARGAGGLECVFHPVAAKPQAAVRVSIRPVNNQSFDFSYEADSELSVELVRLLDDSFWLTDAEKAYAVVPVREGLLIPADSGKAFTHRFGTSEYEGCHMEMFGLVKNGAAALVTWHDPYVAMDLKSSLTNAVSKQLLSPSLVLRKTAKSFRIQFLGKGDYVGIAQAYRLVAKDKGWLVTWDEKLKGHPERAKLFGAINFKLWSTLSRTMNEESTKEERARVNWTFDEAAQIAEHLKNDLKLDKVFFLMGGWIHRGYDNQHPDILPTAPECGGDAAFADCAQRVRRLGYLFGLHDNYQDMYKDAPSWDESYLQKNSDGTPTKGGKWAGGRAWYTCAQKAVDLAKRPQNLPAVKKLCNADAYFIDTTYAVGLQECFDTNHPLTRWDDMKWKQTISDYGREVFGIFGSECGREWAIPHADFFEGFTGVSGTYYHDAGLPAKLGATVIPLFEMVYRDCIAMYGKYGYDPAQSAEYVLHHIAIGRTLNYHSVPNHLYWQNTNNYKVAAPASNNIDPAVFTRAENGWAERLCLTDRFVKNTYEILSPLNELTSTKLMTQHAFLTPDRKVQRTVFGKGSDAVEVVVNMARIDNAFVTQKLKVLLPPYGFVVSSPQFVAFHALSWNGVDYKTPVLFTLRSLDDKPLAKSKKIRVYHGFGDNRIKIGKKTENVPSESVITPE